MENNSVCKTIGIESMRIRMFNVVIKTLIKVAHMSELRKNLISLDCLDVNI